MLENSDEKRGPFPLKGHSRYLKYSGAQHSGTAGEGSPAHSPLYLQRRHDTNAPPDPGPARALVPMTTLVLQ